MKRPKPKTKPKPKAELQVRPYITVSPVDSNQRSVPAQLAHDAANLMPWHRHRQMLMDGRTLYVAGDGIVSGAVHRKADMAIGDAWMPRYEGVDTAWKRRAEELIHTWTNSCDVRGVPFDWQKDLWLISKSLDVDGDIGVLFTRDSDGWPRHQLIEAHRIFQAGTISTEAKTPPVVQDGRYAGRWMYNGVISDDAMRPVAFRVAKPGIDPLARGVPSGDYVDIPAESMVLVHDPRWYSTARGIASICHGMMGWYDVMDTRDAEKVAAKVNSMLTLIHKNETGSRPADDLLGLGDADKVHQEVMNGGLIQYIRHKDSIEAHMANRPSGGWQWFMDHMIRCAMIGMDVPMEVVYDMSKLSGPGVRAVFQQLQRSVVSRQSCIWNPARRMVLHAVATFIAGGMLPFTTDWWRWGFTYPPFATIDVGRDGQNRREDYKLGMTTLSDTLAEQGVSVDEHFAKRASDYLKAAEKSEATGVPMEYLIAPDALGESTVDNDPEEL
jgi:capsid protein